MNKVRVHGWVESIRILKNVKFLVLRNWNGKIQLTIKRNETPIEVWKVVNKLTRESVIEAEGEQVVEKVAKVDAEIKPEKIEILCLAQTPLPLDPTLPIDTGDPNIEIKEPKTLFSTRFKHRSLDLRNPRNQAIFKIQAALVEGMEEWLNQNGFLRVFTPLIIGAPSEGGAEVFKVDYFGREAFLRQDPQLHRQLTIAGGFEKIYDLGTSWRAEKSHTRRHICEFRSCAVEMAFIKDETDVEKVEAEIVKAGIKRAVEKCEREFKILNVEPEIPKTPFPELRFPEIYEILRGYGKKISYGENYDEESEEILWRYVKENYDTDFFFVNRFPFKAKPFYVMKADETWARSIDLIYKGLELSSGGQREHRYHVLIEQIKEKQLNPKLLEWFTDPFKYGVPPHGGFAVGIERLTMQLLNLYNIRDATLYPRDPERSIP